MGVWVGRCQDTTIRWIPPLIVTQEQLEEALATFEPAPVAVGVSRRYLPKKSVISK